MKKGIFSNFTFNQNVILFALSMIGYIAYCVVMIHQRIPFFDEVNAWNISQNCSFTELFAVSRREGHFILWYLLLKPLSLNNIGFLWSMYVLNWFFAFSAVLLLWKKAPFNPWLKVLITFSLPVQMFSVYARCYAIGMLALFAICALYPKRKESPVLYPLLIILLANTSIIGCIAAFVFGLLYCYEAALDLRASKITIKDLQTPFIIFTLGSVFILLQLAFYSVPFYSTIEHNHNKFFEFFRLYDHKPHNLVVIIQPIMLLLGFVFFQKDKKPWFFVLLASGLILLLGYTFFSLAPWHYMFLYLFFVCAMWLYLQEYKLTTVWQKVYYALFFLLSFLTIFYFKFPWHWNGFYIPTYEYVKENMEQYRGSKIFLFPTDSSVIGIVPMLKDYDIEFFGPHGTSYSSYKTYVHQWDAKRIDFDAIKKELQREPEKEAFIFIPLVERWKRDLDYFYKYYNKYNAGVKASYLRHTKDVVIFKLSL